MNRRNFLFGTAATVITAASGIATLVSSTQPAILGIDWAVLPDKTAHWTYYAGRIFWISGPQEISFSELMDAAYFETWKN